MTSNLRETVQPDFCQSLISRKVLEEWEVSFGKIGSRYHSDPRPSRRRNRPRPAERPTSGCGTCTTSGWRASSTSSACFESCRDPPSRASARGLGSPGGRPSARTLWPCRTSCRPSSRGRCSLRWWARRPRCHRRKANWPEPAGTMSRKADDHNTTAKRAANRIRD